MKEKFKWTLYMLYATPVLMLLTIAIAGGGHGYPAPLFVSFPWFAVLGFMDTDWAVLVMALQFPVYGLSIDAAQYCWSTSRFVKFGLVFLHIVAIIALVVISNNRSHENGKCQRSGSCINKAI